jgi:selenocysteine lyase/cysteine desulfurase
MNAAIDDDAFAPHIAKVSVAKRYVYLDNGAVAPICDPAAEGLRRYAEEANLHGEIKEPTWGIRATETRALAAQLLHCKPTEIAFTKNTSEGISFVANGLAFEPGDNVVTTNVEFPANYYPWENLKHKGVELRLATEEDGRIPASAIEALLDDRTRVIALSSVEFSSGFRHDLERIGALCRKRGIFFFIDGIQSVGVLDDDVKALGVHALAADGHKWMLAPEGIAIFYLDEAKLDEVAVVEKGWTNVVNASAYLDYDPTLRPDARRFECGSPNNAGLHALRGSLKMLLDIGGPLIEARALALSDYLCERLESKGYAIFSSRRPKEKSQIVSFHKESVDLRAVQIELRKQQIIVAYRDGRLRASPHFYNTRPDLDRLLNALP